MADFATSLDAQYAKYGVNFSVESNLNCTDISTSYNEFKEPLCGPVKDGFLELTALRVISLPLEIGLCILGIRFVLRNKVDVPKYDQDAEAKDKKGKKGDKGKKGKKGGKGEKKKGKNEETLDSIDKDEGGANALLHFDDVSGSSDEHDEKGGDSSDENGDGANKDDAEGKKGGCFLCCCCKGKSSRKPREQDEASPVDKKVSGGEAESPDGYAIQQART